MVRTTLEQELAVRRRDAFVGRGAEQELFAAELTGEDRLLSVLWIVGPGGVGKSSLLDVFAESARSHGAPVLQLDAEDIVADAGTLAAGWWPDGAPDAGVANVLLLDGLDRRAGGDDWLRIVLLPELPTSTLTVVASRQPPSAEWRSDPAWRDLMRIVSLRNLSPSDARLYLRGAGVGADRHDDLIEASFGHPLALSLLADLAVRGDVGTGGSTPWSPDLVAALLRRFVEGIPGDIHRRALEVCAIARVTTEDLLRDALARDSAGEAFEWLRAQSFIRSGPVGLQPHDLARDVLDIELRWRDPATYTTVFRSVRDHIHRRLHNLHGLEQQRAIADERFVFRNLPSVLSPVDWRSWGEVYPQPARQEDRRPILEMAERFEGEESARLVEQWWERQPGAFHVVRDGPGTIRGFLAFVVLSDPSAGDLAFDPGARAAAEFATRAAPLRPGEAMTQMRFIVDRDCYQAPSPTMNSGPVLSLQHHLRTPNLAWDFVTLFEPEPLDDYFALCDVQRAAGADFEVAGRRYGLFAHDFRRLPVDAWLELVTDRALAQDPVMPPPAPTEAAVLSHALFTDAVRQALRALHRRDDLDRNPLTKTRLVLGSAQRDDGDGDSPGAVLASTLTAAIGSLASDPRDTKRWRALDRTYLRPAPSQEAAAEVLGLPFSTYRRHLTEGVERVVAHLWDIELGRTPTAPG